LSDDMPKTSFAALWGAMQHDKKVIGGKVVGVWPVRIGEVVIRPLDKQACAAWHRSLKKRDLLKANQPCRRAP
jgi:3-dehydroquinate synthase